ncbi:MAG: 16S rRNA (cytosine(1402)-N(4))-methyltransferase RsmH [Candidatus Gracilibacteria bacterium]|jgi:16S rRNA (cytosine1402-N4)-methyltransferase
MEHISVLKNDVEKLLDLKEGNVVIDTTLGLGGHALGLLKKIGKTGKLIAFEQDERNLVEAKKRLSDYKDQIIYIHDNFRYLKNRVEEQNIKKVSAILFDLGLSSPHVDDQTRGFSFLKDGPLDMRFDPRQKLTAEDVINAYGEQKLANIFYEYGEERFSRILAKKIVEQRKKQRITSTLELAELITKYYPKWNFKTSPATKVFQALRIEVNDEISALKEALEQSVQILAIGGKIAIIAYHSLEDRVVKQFFKELVQPKSHGEESLYKSFSDPIFIPLTKKPVVPSEQEIADNKRSRSAKLRVYQKLKEV